MSKQVYRMLPRAMAILLLAWCAAGCDRSDDVQVKLQSRALPNEAAIFMQIEAEVAGPTEGLTYKWFAVSGDCEPQQSDRPKTTYNSPEGVRRDRVTVEVWRSSKRVAESDIKLKFNEELARVQPRQPNVHIQITNVPPSEPGGEHSHADIAGMVSGNYSPDDMVVIYVRAYGFWYVQPQAGAVLQINPDNTWSTWTHTGTRYAALLVRPAFEPLMRLDMLPETNGNVLAVDIVDGVPKIQRTTNTVASEPPPGTEP